jgi:hypothetical protein
MSEGVQMVTVKRAIPLFKKEVEANRVELIELEEAGNMIVMKKGMFNKGDKAIFIAPNYEIPDTAIFREYYRPDGDAKKCKLGRRGRVRAIKFNLHTGNNIPVYSYGILIPYKVFEATCCNNKPFVNYRSTSDNAEIARRLCVAKHISYHNRKFDNPYSDDYYYRPLPTGMYIMNIPDIYKKWNEIKYPIRLIGSKKIDGSSVYIFSYIDKMRGRRVSGICSHNKLIPFYYDKIIKKEIKLSFIQNLLKKVGFHINSTINNIISIGVDDPILKVAKPYLCDLLYYISKSTDKGFGIILRGEITGYQFKGSGNKMNPDSKKENSIQWYCADEFNSNSICRMMCDDEFQYYMDQLNFERCPKLFERNFTSKKQIIKRCEAAIDKWRHNNNLEEIEGIVLRTPDSTFSAKYINLFYDSRGMV